MNSFVFDIGEKSRTVARVLGDLRSSLQSAFLIEKKARKLTQQEIANTLNVNRSVVNRQLMGLENLTVRSAAELAWAMGWQTRIEVYKDDTHQHQKNSPGSTTSNVVPIQGAPRATPITYETTIIARPVETGTPLRVAK
jgi:hypothetical protein